MGQRQIRQVGAIADPDYQSAEIDSNCFAGQVLYIKNSGHLELAQADSLGTATVSGLALTDATATTAAVYKTDSVIELSDWSAGVGTVLLLPGASYFLSADTPGMMTTIAPTAGGQFVVLVGVALSSTRFSIEIAPAIAL